MVDGFDGESTIDLIHRAQGGDTDATAALVRRVRPKVQSQIHGQLGQPRLSNDTDDLVLMALESTLRHLPDTHFPSAASFFGYVRTTGRNAIISEKRKLARQPQRASMPIDAVSTCPSPLDDLHATEAYARYEACFDRLSRKDQGLIYLRLELRKEYLEIQELCGYPNPAAARMAVTHAIERLSLCMSRRRPRSTPSKPESAD